MKSKPQGFLLYGAWVVSLVATFGSLYFSEIKGFIPCELCWYQRILHVSTYFNIRDWNFPRMTVLLKSSCFR